MLAFAKKKRLSQSYGHWSPHRLDSGDDNDNDDDDEDVLFHRGKDKRLKAVAASLLWLFQPVCPRCLAA